MEPIELLRVSVFKTTNNPDLTDTIIRIFEVAGDDTEVAMRSLGNLVGYEFAEFIMQLADIAFDREPALCIDPSYRDATVETEARPKHPTGCFVQPIIAQGNPAKAMRDEQQWQHIRKFNPLLEKEIIKFNNMNEFEKLMYLTTKEMAQKYPIKHDPNRIWNPLPVADFVDENGRKCFYDEKGQPWFRGEGDGPTRKYEIVGKR